MESTTSRLSMLNQWSARSIDGHPARLAVVGAGVFGSSLAQCAQAGGCSVTLIGQNAAILESALCNDAELNKCTLVTQDDPALDLSQFDLILLAVASQALREVAMWMRDNLTRMQPDPAAMRSVFVLNAAKGIENETLLLPSQLLTSILPEGVHVGTLSGPSFASEVRKGLPTAVVVASSSEAMRKRSISMLHRALFRLYESTDCVGVEVAGALKNVVAIVAGGCDGLELGANPRAAVVTRGFGEIAQIGVKLGADPLTFLGLAGFGDLLLTTTGDLSRNRQFGVRLARGESKDAIIASTGQIIEGISTAQSAFLLSQRHGLDTPIIRAAYGVIHENLSVLEAVLSLVTRHHKGEFDWIRNP